jgi:hypothetical protein
VALRLKRAEGVEPSLRAWKVSLGGPVHSPSFPYPLGGNRTEGQCPRRTPLPLTVSLPVCPPLVQVLEALGIIQSVELTQNDAAKALTHPLRAAILKALEDRELPRSNWRGRCTSRCRTSAITSASSTSPIRLCQERRLRNGTGVNGIAGPGRSAAAVAHLISGW